MEDQRTSRSCLILFPHGSRDPKWRTFFQGLESELKHRHGAERIRLAYQQFVAPTLLDAADAALADGIENLRLLPLFMSVSRATLDDIESQVASVLGRRPGVRIYILPPLSDSPDFREVILALAGAASEGGSPGPHAAAVSRPGVGIGVIIIRDGRVLMGRRRNSHGEGTWSFPGGHLEFGETVEDCALRETREETGLEISDVRQAEFTSDLFPDHGKHYVTLFVTADGGAGEPENREPDRCHGWEWFRWDRLPEPLFPPVISLREFGYRPPGT